MCKRAFSLWLTLVLLLTVACPALAEEAAPQLDAVGQELVQLEEAVVPAEEAALLTGGEAFEEVSLEEEPETPEEAEAPGEAEIGDKAEIADESESPVEPELVGEMGAAEPLASEGESSLARDAEVTEVAPSPRIQSVEATAKGICVRWEAVEGAAKYRVMYRLSPSGAWKKLADTAETSYTWAKAKDNKDYLFTLRCLDAAGAEMPGNYDEVGVAFRRLKAPSISQQEPTAEGIRLSWKKVAGAKKYLVAIERDGAWRPLEAVEDAAYLFTDVQSGSAYRFRVCCAAEDGITPVSAWSASGKDALWLSAPEVARVGAAQKGIEIAWGEVPGAAKYRVYSRSGGGSWKKVADVAGTSYTWKKAKANTAYSFAVCCVDKKGKTLTSGKIEDAEQSFTLLSTPKLTGAKLESGGVRVSWKAVAGAERYALLCKSGAEDWREIGTAEAGATDFLWTEAESGASYKFTLRCVTADGALPVSGYDAAGAGVKYLAAPEIQLSCVSTGVNIKWKAVPGVVKYRLLYRQADAAKWKKLKDLTEPGFLWTGAKSGERYAFTVGCVDKKGKKFVSAYDEQGVSLLYVAAPKLTSVLRGNGGVRVEWEAIPGVAKYQVLRRVDGGEWTVVATTSESGYSWTGGDGGAFSVRCLSEDGETPVGGFDEEGASPVDGTPELTGAAWSGNDIVVKWNPVPGAVNYCVLYRSGDEWAIAGCSTGTSYTWKKPKSGKAYNVTVACASASGTAITSKFDQEGRSLLVPMKKLKRYSYFRKYMTDTQMKKVYNIARKIVEPLAGLSREEQVLGIASGLAPYEEVRDYNDRASHYNDPYGYFVLARASCAGCTRAVGFCLNVLGIDYTHENENSWTHQWARVKVGDEWWVLDGDILFAGPEPAPHKHPFMI